MLDEKRAIKKLQNRIDAFLKNHPEQKGCKEVQSVKEIIHLLEQEAAEYNNGWIPCSERLPNRNEIWLGNDITDAEPREFIVMVKGAYEPTTGYYTVDGWVKDICNKGNGSGYANEIIAWRFFPEPFKQNGAE